jgi:hypothetical protein
VPRLLWTWIHRHDAPCCFWPADRTAAPVPTMHRFRCAARFQAGKNRRRSNVRGPETASALNVKSPPA